ncbi:uncharacterized protein LOC111363969 [Spodoptera litura]|uniref:Uncharacterized protein LOC111363969 n=1 Tax=Spodoptera litura TaxID=69820 RepID=A0A9J7EVU8_SPOLT|nr:uncharacterized protein LOC111363969 [Spodoptera litura]
MSGTLDELELQVFNVGDTPTFDTVKGGKALKSQVDVTASCDGAIPKINNKTKLTDLRWFKELAVLKKDVTRKKNRIRNAARVRRAMVVDEYLEAKELDESTIKRAQTTSSKEFCKKQDREGDTAEEDNTDHRHTREAASRVNDWQQDEYHDPPFTSLELKTAVEGLNPKEGPGPDGFTSDICSRAAYQDPDAFLALYNKYLELDIWKEATVIVLRKPGKNNYMISKSYRPIGLLPVLGKVLAVARIKWELVLRFITRQFGVMQN